LRHLSNLFKFDQLSFVRLRKEDRLLFMQNRWVFWCLN